MNYEYQYDDEFYRDILDGLSAYYDSALIADLLTTLNKVSAPGLGNAWNYHQIKGKQWLVEQLAKCVTLPSHHILLLGGWYGILASLILDHDAFTHCKATSLDIDSSCEAVAKQVNQTHLNNNRFNAVTADMRHYDYADHANEDGIIINTSCEHIDGYDDWFANLPSKPLLVLQSNDYYSCDEHVNCVDTLQDFQQQSPMSELLFAGSLKLKKYTRFMLIGRK